MTSRHLAHVLGVSAAASWALLLAPVPAASADDASGASIPGCPDVEVVFARGTGEPPGVGSVGQAFVDSLQSKLGPKSVTVYPVQYPATVDFPTAVDGINDAAAHIEATAANCPQTKVVLGGFSQGAAVAGFVTSAVVPPGAADTGVTGPMPPAVADHVAAVTLFGTPNQRFLGFINQPDIVIGPLYAGKTLKSCVPGDPICSDDADADFALHNDYVPDGLVDQAANYAAGKLGVKVPPPPPPAPVDAQPPPDAP